MSLSCSIIQKRVSFPNVFADILSETSSPEIKKMKEVAFILINLVISGTFDDCP